MVYVHQRPGWPRLVWDGEALAGRLAAVRHEQGRHLGRMEGLGFDLRTEANLVVLTEETVQSSAIEGEHLDAREVRSSLARRLGLDVGGLPEPGRQVDGVVEMMLDATQNFSAPLTVERLLAWHAALFPTGRSGMSRIIVGAWRTPAVGPMRVISRPMGRERVHFEAPPAERIEREMETFLEWLDAGPPIDPVLKAGVAHLWFLTIHPFQDGNGRIGRAIADMLLARADDMEERFYSMSAGIAAERREYYLQLEAAQRGSLDITAWLAWFLGCLERTLDRAGQTLAAVLRKARFWQRIALCRVNERQRRVLARLLEGFEGHLTTSKYAKLAKCSTDTALRDIRELVEHGLLLKSSAGGRSTSYRLADLETP